MLCVSTREGCARQFVRTMQRGVAEYNCRVNSSKTQANFNDVHGFTLNLGRAHETATRLTSARQGMMMTMTAMAGTTVSMWDWKASDTITYWLAMIPTLRCRQTTESGHTYSRDTDAPAAPMRGADIRRLTRGFLKPRAHALLFDTTINSACTAAFNVFELECSRQ